ncbi:MAG TPA: SufD family Fe-S cluster assembly protein [Candidatus Omnitrophota bacterium]|nr:SufD family Fe-S cluster assembly protein [Candidatus Omnitrophota bacterium]HQJ16159.1 SufD family Fe-S cluster assembly protein [Candidatus Omnitrophota bacterium]
MSRGEITKHIEAGEGEILASSGMDATEKTRSGSFLQKDGQVSFSHSLIPGVDILAIREALKSIPEAKEYYGSAFTSLKREFPRDTEGGYFIRVKKGVNVELPIQACLFLKSQGFKQKVHNIVIIEEGARVYLITGCSASAAAKEGFHLGISEFFVKKDAFLNFTMIHSWREDVTVKPMSISLLDQGATFISNYVCLKPVKEIVMYPTSVLSGKGSRAVYNSLILSHPGSLHDVGSRAILAAEDAHAEMIARSVSLGGSVINRAHIKAEFPRTKGHIECRGLVMSEKGYIHAIPEMESDLRDVDLSHEAAIGKLRREEIEYLCSRGFSRDEAQSIIVRGFMDVNILGLPDKLRGEIEKIEERNLQSSF